MQRIMSLVGKKPYSFKFDDGRSASGFELHFIKDMVPGDESEGQEVFFGRLSYQDADLCDGGINVGEKYIVVSDKAQGKLMAVIRP